jgi:nicotinate-nucleotide adenylyltransferase
MAIGLYGGSFNPPHPGHIHVTRTALTRLGLDRVWWLMTPGNPLKDASALAPLAQRMEAARALIRDRRVVVTDVEHRLGLRYSVDTVAALKLRAPGVRFVWIMGADSLATFHRWRRWRDIAAMVPIAVIDRPGWTLAATAGRAAETLAPWRLDEREASRLAATGAPAWTLIHGPRSVLSSTALRGSANGPR